MKVLPRPFKCAPLKLHSIIKQSDSMLFRIRTTTPKSVFIQTKDTANHPLWNPSSVVVDDQEGVLKKFDQRFKDLDLDQAVGSGAVVMEKKKPLPTTISSSTSSGGGGGSKKK